MAFLAPLIVPLFATTSAALTTTAVIGATAYAVGSSQAAGAAKKEMAANLAAPNAPQNYNAILANETQGALRRAQSRTKTILTSPLGVTDNSNANVQRKTLLGA